jgi:hypothetical protein
MASPSAPPPVKLICGILSARSELLERARAELAAHFGPLDVVSEIMDFDFTHYYDQEMGTPLLRQFVAFADLVPPESIVEAKHATNAMEGVFAPPRGCREDAADHGTRRRSRRAARHGRRNLALDRASDFV